MPLLPDRHPQKDLFILDIADVVPKDNTASMEHPLFSLAAKPDMRHNHALADVEKRIEQLRVEALRRKGITLDQHADGIMTMQAFLMARDNAEVPYPRLRKKLFAKEPRRILDEDRVGSVQLSKSLFVFAFDHHLGLCRHRPAAEVNQVFKPEALLCIENLHRNPRDRAL